MNLEDLARLRVNEALRNGIEAQRIHRALSENGHKRVKTVVLDVPKLSYVNKPRKPYMFWMPRNILLRIVGFLQQ